MADTIGINLVGVDAASSVIRGVGGALSGLGDAAADVTKKFAAVGAIAGGAALAGVVALGKAGVDAWSDFDAGIDTVAQKTGLMGDDLDALGTSIQNIKASSAGLGVSMEDIGSAMADVSIKTGATGPALEALTSSLLRLQQMQGEGAVGAEEFGAAMNLWQVPAQLGTGMLDQLFVASQKFGTTTEQMTAELTKFGPALQEMGFGLDESIALLGSLDKAGLDSSAVMTGMRTAMKGFAKDGVDASTGLASLISSIQNADSQTQALGLAITSFGAKAGPAMLTAIQSGTFALEDGVAAIQNYDDAIQSAQEGAMDFPDRLAVAMSKLQTALVPVGQSVMDLADAAMPALMAGIDLVAGGLTGFATSLAAIAPQAGSVATVIGNVLSTVLQNVVTIAQNAAPAFMALASAVGGVLSAAFGVVQTVIAAVLPLFQQATGSSGSLADIISGVLVTALNMLTGFLTGTVIPALNQLAVWLAANLPGAIQTLSSFWTGTLQPAIATVAAWVTGTLFPILGQVVAWLADNIPPALSALAQFWTGTLWPAIQVVAAWVSGTLIPLLGQLVTWLATNIPVAVQSAADMWTNTLQPALSAVWSFIDGSVIPLLTALGNVFTAVVNVAVEAAAGLWQNVLQPALSTVWNFIQTNLNPILSALGDLFNSTVIPALNSANTAVGGLSGVMGTVQGIISSVTGKLNEFAASLQNIQLPDFLQRHSPSPIEQTFIGLQGVVPSVAALMATFAGSLNAVAATNAAKALDAIQSSLESLVDVLALAKQLWSAGQGADVNGIANLMFIVHDIVMAAGNARGGVGSDIVGPFQRLSDAFSAILASLKTLVDLTKLMGEAAGSLNVSGLASLQTQIVAITAQATRIVVAAAPATAAINAVNTSGLKPLNDALQALGGIIDSTVGAVTSLLDERGGRVAWATAAQRVGQQLVDLAVQLTTFGVRLVNAAGPATAALNAVPPQMQQLQQALQGASTVITSVGESVTALLDLRGGRVAWAISAVRVGQEIVDLFGDLAAFGVRLVNAAAPAAASLSTAATSLQPLSQALQSLEPIFKGVTSLVTFILDGIKTGIPTIDTNIATELFINPLIRMGLGLAQGAVRAVGTTVLASDALGGLQSVLGGLTGVFTDTINLVHFIFDNLKAGLPTIDVQGAIDMFIGPLIRLGLGLARGAAQAAGTVVLADDALAGIQGVLGGLTDLFSDTINLVGFIFDGLKRGLPTIDVQGAIDLFIKPLITLGLGLARGAVLAAGETVLATDALQSIGSALSGLTDIFDDTRSLIIYIFNGLKTGLPTIDVPVTIELFIGPMIGLARGLAAGAVRAAGTTVLATDALSSIKTVLSDMLDTIAEVIDAGKLIAQLTQNPPSLPDAKDAAAIFIPLIRWGQTVTDLTSHAVGIVSLANQNIQAVGGVLGDMVSTAKSVLDIGKMTADLIKSSPSLPSPEDAEGAFIPLIRWGQIVADHVSHAVGVVQIATQNIGDVGGVLGDMLGTAKQVLDVLKQTTSLIENPVNLPSPAAAVIAFLPLIRWGQVVAQQLAQAVGSILLATQNAGDVGSVLGDMLGAVKSVLDTLKMTAALVENPVSLPSPAQAVIAFLPLVRWGQVVAQQLAQTTGGILLATQNAGDVSSVLGDMLGAVGRVVDAGEQITALMEKPVSLPTPAAAVAMFLPLIRWAQQVTVSVAQAVGLVTIAENSLGELGSTLGDALTLLAGGLKLSDLQTQLASFRGFNFGALGASLDLLIADIIEVARRFGQAATRANIPQAFADAGEKIGKLFSAGVDALDKGIGLAMKLADPETQIPSVGQIQQKLTAALTFLSSVVTQVNATAAALVAQGVNFEQVTAVAEAAKGAFDVINDAVDTISTLREKHVGSDDLGEISTFLADVFSIFDAQSPNAANVEAVTAAISAVMGVVGDMISDAGTTAGTSFGEALVNAAVAAISAGASQIAAALPGQGTNGTGSGAGGSVLGGGSRGSGQGGTVIDNSTHVTVNVTQYATESALKQSAANVYTLASLYGA